MSPAAKSKSKDKSSGRDQKVQSKLAATNGGTSASAYNPVSGTFHMLESVTVYAGGSSHNGRFKNIDDIDENAGSLGTNTDSDSVSNNGSCSGESEDQKDKQGVGRSENPPGLVGGNDRRDKIRHKNEKKHQRQKEKRAQELRDRCTGYLMSRKLEALSQQLVSMGFSSERATMALILNEGRVEDSVNWLLEGGDGDVKEDRGTPGNLKIDISEELSRIAHMERTFKCPRSEVERTVVFFEGDLDKAAELLLGRRQEVSPPKSEDKMTTSGIKVTKEMSVSTNKQPAIPLQAPAQRNNQIKTLNSAPGSHPQKREEKDYNYVKSRQQTVPLRVVSASEATVKSIPPLGRSPLQTKGEWLRPPSPAEKKASIPASWPSSTSTSSVSFSVNNKTQVGTFSKPLLAEIRQRTVVLDSKPLGREPVVVMQRPQSSYTPQLPVASVAVSSAPASSILSTGWNANYADPSTPLNFHYSNGSTGLEHLKGVPAGKVSVASSAKGNMVTDMQGHFQPLLHSHMDSVASSWSSGQIGFGSSEASLSSSSLINPLTSSSIPSSLGIYSGWSPGRSAADWNAGSVINCDYTNIDWSIQPSPSSQSDSRINRFSHGFTALGKPGDTVCSQGSLQNLSVASSPSSDNSGSYDLWLGSKAKDSSNGMQENSATESANATSSIGVYEWTSPFAGKDLFRLNRQLVPTPPL